MTKLEQAARQVDKLSLRAEQDCEESLGDDGMAMVVPLDAYNDMMEAIAALREALADLQSETGIENNQVDYLNGHSRDATKMVSDHFADSGKVMLTAEQAQQIEETLVLLCKTHPEVNGGFIVNMALNNIRTARAQEQAGQEPIGLNEVRRIAAEYTEQNSQVDSGNLYWALCEALKYTEPKPVISDVFFICDAYESGFGHGAKNDGLNDGSIFADSRHGEAYELGYSEGLKRSKRAQEQAEREPIKYLVEATCTKCGATESGVLKFKEITQPMSILKEEK